MDYLPIIAVVVVILFISLILYFVPLGLWIQSVVSLGLGKISIIDLIRMRLRKIPPRLIVDSIINMQKAGLTNKGRKTNAELNFYKNVRNSMVSLLTEIQAYDRGERRFSKQYYNKLIKQLNRLTGITFDYESGIDNSQDIIEDILR